MPLTQLAPPYPIFTDKNGDPLDAGFLYFGVVNQNPETQPIQVYYDSALTQPAAQPLRTSNGYVMRNGTPALIYADSQFSVTVRDKSGSLVIYSPVGYGVDPASISGTVIYDNFTGNGVTTVFTLTASPSTKNATNVYIDGVYQSKDNYNTVGSTLTFSTAPPLNSAIEVVSQESSIIGGAGAQQITYNQGGAGSITRTVQSRLRDFVSVKDFGAVGDGVTDDTAAIQAAFTAADGQILFLTEGSYLITDQITMPDDVEVIGTGSFICTGDEQYWFYADAPNRIVWHSFIAEVTTAFGSRVELNRVLVCNNPTYFEVKTAKITGASTAIQCINGDDFVCGDILLFDVLGIAAQYGYGINTGAKRITINSLSIKNTDATNGRHGLYVVGSQWQKVTVDTIYVENFLRNPVQITNTDATAYADAWIGNATFVNVNQDPTADTTGCIHMPSTSTNASVSVGTVRVRGIKGPALSSLASGDGGFIVDNLFADDIEPAANAATRLVYMRFGSNKHIKNVVCTGLNTDWSSAILFRDTTDAILDNLYLGGSTGNQAVTVLTSTNVFIGNIQSGSIPPILNSGSTIKYTALDYVEGTWTVELYDAASGGNVSPTTSTGYYKKIGNLVVANFALTNINTTGMNAGNALFFTLPIAAAATIGNAAGNVILDSVTFPAGRTYASPRVLAGQSRGDFRCSGSGVTDASVLISGLSTGVSDKVVASIQYFVG
jgi:hypothetical protein